MLHRNFQTLSLGKSQEFDDGQMLTHDFCDIERLLISQLENFEEGYGEPEHSENAGFQADTHFVSR